MNKRIYDACVCTGESNGKKNWKRIGSILQGTDGSKFMLMDKSFNPAGIPSKNGSDSIIVSFFDVKQN